MAAPRFDLSRIIKAVGTRRSNHSNDRTYYLAIALLLQSGSGIVTQEALEQRCHLMAQRMSVLHGLNSPEFFDKSLFRNFIDLLRRRGVIQTLTTINFYSARRCWTLRRCAAGFIAQIRHSILQVTLGNDGLLQPRPPVAVWCCRAAFSNRCVVPSRPCRPGFLRTLGSIIAAPIIAARRPSATRRFCSWLRSLLDLSRILPSSTSFWPARRADAASRPRTN